MERVSRSWSLAKASWSVLRADRELVLLPLASAITTMIVMATFLVPAVLIGAGSEASSTGGTTFHMRPLSYVLIGLMYFVTAYVTIFFNTALICAADMRMRGGDPTLGSALRGAAARAGAILPWAIISATVSVLLRTLEQRTGALGRIAIGLVGVAWSVVTFLVLPILVLEDVSAVTALKRSAELFKSTWGENVVARAAMGVIATIALLIALPAVLAAFAMGYPPAIFTAAALAVVWMLCVMIVLSALSGIYQVALYRYAADGKAPPAFASVDLAGAFRPKKRSRD